MTFNVTSAFLRLTLAAGLVAAALPMSAAFVSASSGRKGDLHVTKECSAYTGLAGQFCTIIESNLKAIPKGSRVFYDQAAGIPAGLLDSNVVLDAGHGNRAVGRCTLDLTSYLGVCTFSAGTGQLAGFHASVDVSFRDGVFDWDGSYRFKS
jgi:hypothetical protein